MSSELASWQVCVIFANIGLMIKCKFQGQKATKSRSGELRLWLLLLVFASQGIDKGANQHLVMLIQPGNVY